MSQLSPTALTSPTHSSQLQELQAKVNALKKQLAEKEKLIALLRKEIETIKEIGLQWVKRVDQLLVNGPPSYKKGKKS